MKKAFTVSTSEGIQIGTFKWKNKKRQEVIFVPNEKEQQIATP